MDLAWYWWGLIAVCVLVGITVTLVMVLEKGSTTNLAAAVSPSVAGGVTHIDAILVVDTRNNSGDLQCGDFVQMSYIGQGKGNVQWDYQVNATGAYTTIQPSTLVNPVTWKIPGTIYGSVVFRVSSVNNLTITGSSAPRNVYPVVTWVGVGALAKNYVTLGTTMTISYMTTGGDWVKEGAVTLSYATPVSRFKVYTQIDPSLITVDESKKTLSWPIAHVSPGVYQLQVVTTGLVKRGYPKELSFIFPKTISIVRPVDYNPNDGRSWGTASVMDTNGVSGSYAPGDKVIPKHDGTIGTPSWYWSIANSNTWLKMDIKPDDGSWIIPVSTQGDYQIRAYKSSTSTPDQKDEPTSYAETDINVGAFFILPNDSGTPAAISYDKPLSDSNTTVTRHLFLYIYGYAVSDPTPLADTHHWSMGWYNRPDESVDSSRYDPMTILGIHVVSAFPSTNMMACDIFYEDNGYDRAGDKDPSYPMYIEYGPLNGSKVTYVTQTITTLSIK